MPHGPIGDMPKRDEMATVMTTILEKRKVAAAVPVPVQMLHDAELSMLEDFMHDTVLLKLESFVFEEKLHHGTEVVPFSKTKFVPRPSRLPYLILSLILAAVAVVALVLGAPAWVYLMVVASYVVAAAIDHIYTAKEAMVTVRGEVEFDVDTLVRFPENTKVYPHAFGRPYKNIEVRTWMHYDDEEQQ